MPRKLTPYLKGKTIVVGVCRGIAAYWSAEIVGQLKNMNAEVYVIMTENATKSITPLTFQTVTPQCFRE